MAENFDLFAGIDLTVDDFLSPNESVEPATTNEEVAVADALEFDIFADTAATEEPVAPVKEDPVVPVKEVVAKESKTKKTAKKADKKPAVKDEDLEVSTEWTIAYAGQQMNPPHDKMKVEDVRQWLEVDFPELSKERCKWSIEKKKKLMVPIVSGAKKG